MDPVESAANETDARRRATVSPPSEPAAAPMLYSLGGLRTLAALTVFGYHVGSLGLVDEGPVGQGLRWVFGQGKAGFSMFIVLSGFVLTWSARPAEPARRFWLRRLARIYPTHVVTWAATVAGVLLAGGTLSLAVVLPNLFLVQAWVPDPTVYYGLNTVSWSLACELLFYAVFPLLLRGLRRITSRQLWPITVAVFAVIWLIPVLAHPLPEDLRYWAIWMLPIARLPEFVVGMLLARIVREGRWPAIPLPAVVAVAGAAVLACRWLPTDFAMIAGASFPMAAVVATAATADAAQRPTFLRSTPLLMFGRISFAFYLVHYLVLRVVARVFGRDLAPMTEVGIALLALVTAVALAVALHWGIERPFVRLARRTGRRAAATPPPPAIPMPRHEEAVAVLTRE